MADRGDWVTQVIEERDALRAEVERLRRLVKQAYYEGFDDAVDHAWLEKTARRNKWLPGEIVDRLWEEFASRLDTHPAPPAKDDV